MLNARRRFAASEPKASPIHVDDRIDLTALHRRDEALRPRPGGQPRHHDRSEIVHGEARNQRIKRLHMICLAENRRVRRLALKFDAELSFQYGSVVGEMKTSRPTPWRKAIPQARSAFRSITSTGL